MKASRYRRLATSILALALGCVCGPALADGVAAAQAYLARLAAQSGSPGVSAAVAVKGEIVFSGGVGIEDVQSGLPESGLIVHNIGSISKTIAVVALLQLVEQGKVDLDAQLQTYVPWFPRKPWPITVRQILTHTSGIRTYKDGEFGAGETVNLHHYTQFEPATRFWRDDPLVFEPGTRWLYSSYAVDLAQAIVEEASGEPFEEYLTERVWRPAGMLGTQLDVVSRIVAQRGHGYVRNQKTGLLENAPDEDVSYKYAGGGVIATDEDLCRFAHALNAGVLLKPKTLQQMYTLQLPPDILNAPEDEETQAYERAHPGMHPPSMGRKQALIFRVGHDPSGRPYAYHPGKVKGVGSMLLSFYIDDVVVALHFNADMGAVDKEAAALALASLFSPSIKANVR
jgi:CubicO group peptidase (beta-lactamase class C family)